MSRNAVGLWVLAGAVVLAACLPASGAAEENTTSVVKYVGSKTAKIGGKEVMVVVVGPKQGAGAKEITVPNRDKDSKKLDPPSRIVDTVKELKPGDLIRVVTFVSDGRIMLEDIEKYQPQPGEDDPYAFTFVEFVEDKAAGGNRLGVKLKKDEKTVTVWLPKVKNAEGQMVPDEELAQAAGKFHEGDIVEVRVQGSGQTMTLKSIWEYKAPETAEFVKTSEQQVGEVNYLAVELKKDEQTTTVRISSR